MSDDLLRENALDYHRADPPGKLAVVATKPLGNQRDLALAYSPGVAAACEAIVADPAEAARVTARGNLVAVISNGTAVLGLGHIGPLAAKPVMEGKAVLFKKFAGIDVFDIEVAETDPDKFVDIVAALEPTFGGVNLEDIKAPECFEIERRLRERMSIPVFHDDQHGTAIIVGAAVLNGTRVAGKKLEEIKLVTSGAGAAGLACLDLLVSLGVKRENIWVTDIEGVVYEGRAVLMDERKAGYAQATEMRTLAEVLVGADVFLGVSAAGVLKPEMVKTMAETPLILALANPTPEIMPDIARAARPDAMIATGRSDFPNQVNNVLCFPFLFRGALDCGATDINEEMKLACVKALADLATAEGSWVVAQAYGGDAPPFGPENLIPKPFDPRLIAQLPPAVAEAAAKSGVAQRPIEDIHAYRRRLERHVWRSGLLMKPLFDKAQQDKQRVVYGDGEEERVLRAVQQVVDEGLANPILIGRRRVIASRMERFHLRLEEGWDYDLVDPEDDPRYDKYSTRYHELMGRNGVSPAFARQVVRTDVGVIAALMLDLGDADAAILGPTGAHHKHYKALVDVVGFGEGVRSPSAISVLILPTGTYFIADTHVVVDPTAEEVAEQTMMAAREVRRFGVEPKVALLSHSNFGSRNTPRARKMRQARELLSQWAPELEVEGEMQADAALSETIRSRLLPDSKLQGSANVLIMPDIDAASIAFNLMKSLSDGLLVGPIMSGLAKSAHIVSGSATVRGILNMTAVAACCAQQMRQESGAANSNDPGASEG